MSMNTDWEYGNRKLAHYNKWLLDPKRESGTIYPGFPEDLQRERALAKLKAEVTANTAAKADRPKIPAKAPVKVKRTRTTEGPTKLDQAVELMRANPQFSKVEFIELFRNKLSMSQAGATTYFYSASKALRT